MRKLITLCILGMTCIIPLEAGLKEKESFGYGSLGTIGGYPTLGAGYRLQYQYHGFDISGKVVPWITFTPAAEIKGLYLFYPKKKGMYLGSGSCYIWEKETLQKGSVSLTAAAGYQWETVKDKKFFLQIEGIAPFKDRHFHALWPALTVGMGF
jgi:hypothetical protein